MQLSPSSEKSSIFTLHRLPKEQNHVEAFAMRPEVSMSRSGTGLLRAQSSSLVPAQSTRAVSTFAIPHFLGLQPQGTENRGGTLRGGLQQNRRRRATLVAATSKLSFVTYYVNMRRFDEID